MQKKYKQYLNGIRRRSECFVHQTDGAVMLLSALLLPVLVFMVGATLNYGLMILDDQRLQAATDAAALGVAKELQLINTIDSPDRARTLALAFIQQDLNVPAEDLNVTVAVDEQAGEVTVKAQQYAKGYLFAERTTPKNTLTAVASAKVVGKIPVCVIGLDEQSSGAIRLEQNARMTGKNCAVYSNSSNTNGLKSKDNAVLSAALICSAGGTVGGKANFTPTPLTDCPIYEDPLADRPAPPVGSCINTAGGSKPEAVVFESGSHTLEPGTYCGGITVGGDAVVGLKPGIYVMKDGPLKVRDRGELSGDYVSFYFTGDNSVFSFGSDAVVSLTATAEGVMAGLLFFEDRANKEGMKHEIYSNHTRNLLGTIYMSRGRIYIGADAPIADESAYTAIVTQKLELEAGPHLVLNTNYDQTDVPVPDGIYGGGSRIMLTR